MELGSRLLIALLWLLHWLPFGWQVRLGRGVGFLFLRFGHRRRAIAERNLSLCFPEWSTAERAAVLREHFALLGRSFLERGMFWFAAPERLKSLIQIEGDIELAQRTPGAVMWLVPHFMGLEVAGVAVQLFQQRRALDIYQPQRSQAIDRALKQGRLRFGGAEAYPRNTPIRQIVKRLKEGCAFFNMPDQDFGRKDSTFVPFFGVTACTLMAPSKFAKLLDMTVQPLVVEMLPGAQGWRVRCLPTLTGFPTDDPVADTAWLNQQLEQWIRQQPSQYLWVHKRFKTRPEGEPSVYR
jgi:Kdo2-lipid IVA lauroyltransferase/acyltransferase